MYFLRQFLSRSGATKQAVLLTVFVVLLARALLAATVMLDPDAPAGSFGLVLCSGYGPVRDRGAADARANGASVSDHAASTSGMAGMGAMPGMPMGAMPSLAAMHAAAQHVGAAMPGMHDGGDTQDNQLCAFSAAFALAVVGVVLLLVWRRLRYTRKSWRPDVVNPLPRNAVIRRHRARAPPFFSVDTPFILCSVTA